MQTLAVDLIPQPSVAAYCSLSTNIPGIDPSDRDRLTEFCLQLDGISDMFAEEISPEANKRPVFNLLMMELSAGYFSEIIFPSVFHIAGQNKQMAEAFLKFACDRAIIVKTIKEGFDSSLHDLEVALCHVSTFQ